MRQKIDYIVVSEKDGFSSSGLTTFCFQTTQYSSHFNKLLKSIYIKDCAKAEWDEELKPDETNGFTLPKVEMDGKEIYLICIKEDSDIDDVLKHELKHIYKNEFYLD